MWMPLGFCVRDWLGRVILAGSASSSASSALVAEVLSACWAVDEVLRLPWSGPYILEGDSAMAVAWMDGEAGSLMPALQRARTAMRTRGDFTTMLISREGNHLADRLAHLGKGNIGSSTWTSAAPPPSDLFLGLDPPVFFPCTEL